MESLSEETARREEREEKEDEKRQNREAELTREYHEFFTLLKSFIAAQTEINKAVEIGLIGAMDKLSVLQRQVNESETVKQLLIELVRKKVIPEDEKK